MASQHSNMMTSNMMANNGGNMMYTIMMNSNMMPDNSGYLNNEGYSRYEDYSP